MAQAVAYLLVGVQGSGKSTWARENADALGAVILASDDVRNEFEARGVDATDQGDRVFAILEDRLSALLAEGHAVIVDATHARRAWRAREISRARAQGARLVAVWFDVPLADCLARNARKPGGGRWGDRVVPRTVVMGVAQRFEPPALDEFDEIWRIDSAGKLTRSLDPHALQPGRLGESAPGARTLDANGLR